MVKHSKPVRQKHIPQRTCVGCRQVEGKRELVRVVRIAEGRVEIDPTGKRAGRGAYVHRARACWQAALQRGQLELALKTNLQAQDRAALDKFMETLDA